MPRVEGAAYALALDLTAVAEVCAELVRRFGPRFAERLTLAAGMVDGVPTERDSEEAIRPGAEVALLPPFAGG